MVSNKILWNLIPPRMIKAELWKETLEPPGLGCWFKYPPNDTDPAPSIGHVSGGRHSEAWESNNIFNQNDIWRECDGPHPGFQCNLSHVYFIMNNSLDFLKITTFLSEVWVEISVSSFDHLGGALPCDAGADSNKRQHLALQGEMNYDSTLNLFLWLAFHCFCYYSPYITASLRESYPSAWLLSESTFVQYPGHL